MKAPSPRSSASAGRACTGCWRRIQSEAGVCRTPRGRASCPMGSRRSEIRFVGLRNRMEILIEVVHPGTLCASHLRHRHLVLAPCLFKCELPVERVGIFDRYDRSQGPTVLADCEPLDDVEFLGVRRAKGIDVVVLAGSKPDRIDHERVPASVMPDGIAEPGRLHIFRMLVGEIDAAHKMITLPYHPYLVRRLEEIQGLEKKELARYAPRPAAGLGGKGNRHLAAQHLFIGCLHLFRGPRFQDRIVRVHDRGPEFTTRKKTAILNLTVIGIVRIGLNRPVSRTLRRVELKIPEVRVPAEISGTKLGNRILYGRGHGKRRNKSDCKKAGDNTAP